MNKLQQQTLIDLLDTIRKGQSSQNKIKTHINSNPTQINTLFENISSSNQFIAPSHLSLYLNSKFQLSPNDIYLIFKKFDHDLRGRIYLEDFKKQLTPIVKENRLDKTDQTLEQLFEELIRSYIKYQDLLNVCRKELKSVIPYQMFDQLEYENKGYISAAELVHFYQINDRRLKESYCTLLMNGLRGRSHSKITLEAFCQVLDPFEMGYYRQYTQQIQSYQNNKYQQQQRMANEIIRQKKKLDDKIKRTENQNRRLIQASEDRCAIIQQLRQLKEIAKQQKNQRKVLQQSLKFQQKIRHQLESQINSFKKQYDTIQMNRKDINRLHKLRDQELYESRQFDDRISYQDQYLNGLKSRVYLEKKEMYQRSNINKDRIINLRPDQNRELRELQIQQQSLYNRLLYPQEEKLQLSNSYSKLNNRDIGKIHKSSNISNHQLYKSLGSTKSDQSLWLQNSQSQPKFSMSYLYRY